MLFIKSSGNAICLSKDYVPVSQHPFEGVSLVHAIVFIQLALDIKEFRTLNSSIAC